MSAQTCWCGGEVGPREPGNDNGLGCLEDMWHLWDIPESAMVDEEHG